MGFKRSVYWYAMYLAVLGAICFVGVSKVVNSFNSAENTYVDQQIKFIREMLVASGSVHVNKGSTILYRRPSDAAVSHIGHLIDAELSLRPNGSATATGQVRRRSVFDRYIVTHLTLLAANLRPAYTLKVTIKRNFAGLLRASLGLFVLVLTVLMSAPLAFILLVAPVTGNARSTTGKYDDEDLRRQLELAQVQHLEGEDLFRQMAINASDVLYAMYPDTARVDWYGQIDLMLGYAQGSFPRTIDAWAESIHPEEAESIIELYTRAWASGEPFAVEYRMRHRNGGYRDWSHRGRMLVGKKGRPNRVIGACSDITDRRSAERALRESEERSASIFETVADSIVLCDRDGRVTSANPATEQVFGVERKEFVGSLYNDNRWQVVRPDGAPLESRELPPALVVESGMPVHGFEHSITQPSGRIVVVSVNAAPLHSASGELTGSILSLADITGRKELEDRLSYQAFHDPLTKLPNRALFIDRLQHAIVRAARSKNLVAVFFIDLDNFKHTNDTLGHDAGDALLIETAARICSSIRGGDTAARMGGDEFTVLLENIPESSHAQIVAERLLGALLEKVLIKNNDVYAPPSIGIALGKPGQTADEVMADADTAMYRAKKKGKARYEFFE